MSVRPSVWPANALPRVVCENIKHFVICCLAVVEFSKLIKISEPAGEQFECVQSPNRARNRIFAWLALAAACASLVLNNQAGFLLRECVRE